jgi:hypothetical protein
MLIFMKSIKFWLLLFWLLLIAQLCIGQVQFGFRAGLNFSTIENNTFLLQTSSTPMVENDVLVSPDLGLFTRVSLGEKIFIQPEIHYLQKGATLRENIYLSGNGGTVIPTLLETKYKVQFIEVPIVVGYQLALPLRPAIMLGASYGRAFRQEFEGDDLRIEGRENALALSGQSNQLPWDANLLDGGDFQQNDWSLVLGLGLEQQIGSYAVVFDVRYLHDMNDWRTEKLSIGNDPQVRNRSLVISVGLAF